jgi:hypothetical protein
VKRVIVSIQPVQQRRLAVCLVLKHGVGLFALGRGVVDGGRALGTAPVALRDEEGAADGARVDFARGSVDEVGLRLDDGARTALVIDAEDLGADLELTAGAGGRKGLEELDAAFAVDDAFGVEFGDTGYLGGLLGGVEVDYFLGGPLEGCDGNALVVLTGWLTYMNERDRR